MSRNSISEYQPSPGSRRQAPPTYVENELRPYGYQTVERHERGTITVDKVVMKLGETTVAFTCICPDFPRQKAMGCPLHHDTIGGSWPVIRAKEQALIGNEI